MAKQQHLAQIAVKVKNCFSVRAIAELTMSKKKMPFVNDVCFLEFSNGLTSNEGFKYDYSNNIVVMMDLMKLRAFKLGLTTLLETKNSTYKNFSNASLSSNTTDKGQKLINFKCETKEDQEIYYINVTHGNKECTITLEHFPLASLIEELTNLCDYSRKKIFELQREMEVFVQKKIEAESQN